MEIDEDDTAASVGKRQRLRSEPARVLRLAVSRSGSDDLALAAADLLGLWEGFVVERVVVGDCHSAVSALCHGVHAACCSYLPLLVDQSASFKVLCSTAQHLGQCLVSRPGIAAHLVAVDVGGPVELLAKAANTSTLPVGSAEERVAALLQGQVFAAFLPLGLALRALEQQELTCLASVSELARLPQAHNVLVASHSLCDDDALGLTRALVRASRQLHESPQLIWRLHGGKGGIPTQLGELAASGFFAVNGAMSRNHWGLRLEGSARTYEEFSASTSLAQSLAKLGRHSSVVDEL